MWKKVKSARRAPEKAVPGMGLGVRGQLMLFLCAVTLFTLGLVWALITYALEPMYNRKIRTSLEAKADAVVALIDANDGPVSSRILGKLVLDEDFWLSFLEKAIDGSLDLENCCVDISDSTLSNVQCLESLYPCVLHQSEYSFGGKISLKQDTPEVVRLRGLVFTKKSVYETVSSGGNLQMVVGKLTADGQYAVLVSTSLAQITTAADVLRSVLPPVALLLFGLNVVAAILFSRWFTHPVYQLAGGARRMAAGRYDVQVEVKRRDELGLLAKEFNHMALAVQRSAELEKELLANVSHDLRTPLTLIKGYAETVRDLSGMDEEKRTEQCNIIVDETDRLSALVNSVMELSKVQSGVEKPNLVDFDMSGLCFEVAGLYDAVCEQNHWTLQLEADKECMVRADPAMMERVLHNLLGNATHHIGEDGVFVLRAIPLPAGGCRIEVEDHGPGIPPEDLPYIFDRYYRARKNAGKPGTGLGLSITKAILQQHGFPFGVKSEVGRGSLFWFEMTAPDKQTPPKE